MNQQTGRRFVGFGHTVTDDEMTDHICIRNDELIAVEVPYKNDVGYEAVQNPIPAELIGRYLKRPFGFIIVMMFKKSSAERNRHIYDQDKGYLL